MSCLDQQRHIARHRNKIARPMRPAACDAMLVLVVGSLMGSSSASVEIDAACGPVAPAASCAAQNLGIIIAYDHSSSASANGSMLLQALVESFVLERTGGPRIGIVSFSGPRDCFRAYGDNHPSCSRDGASRTLLSPTTEAWKLQLALTTASSEKPGSGLVCLSCALEHAAEELDREPVDATPVIILISEHRQAAGGTDALAIDTARRLQAQQGILIVTIALDDAVKPTLAAVASTPAASSALVQAATNASSSTSSPLAADVLAERALDAVCTEVCVHAPPIHDQLRSLALIRPRRPFLPSLTHAILLSHRSVRRRSHKPAHCRPTAMSHSRSPCEGGHSSNEGRPPTHHFAVA